MNIREAFYSAQDLARVISAIHMSNGLKDDPRCISCDQEFPCLTHQHALAIEQISLSAPRRSRVSGPGSLLRSRADWLSDALQNIAMTCRVLFDERSEEYSAIFEQFAILQNLTGIVQTGIGGEAHSMIKVSLIHPHSAEPIPLWAIHSNYLYNELKITLWLNPGDTTYQRSFLVDIMCKVMQPLEVSQLLDWWKEPDIAPACIVDFQLPNNGQVVHDVVSSLVQATVEAASQIDADSVVDWDDWAQDWE
jgi:hypothetical protein